MAFDLGCKKSASFLVVAVGFVVLGAVPAVGQDTVSLSYDGAGDVLVIFNAESLGLGGPVCSLEVMSDGGSSESDIGGNGYGYLYTENGSADPAGVFASDYESGLPGLVALAAGAQSDGVAAGALDSSYVSSFVAGWDVGADPALNPTYAVSGVPAGGSGPGGGGGGPTGDVAGTPADTGIDMPGTILAFVASLGPMVLGVLGGALALLAIAVAWRWCRRLVAGGPVHGVSGVGNGVVGPGFDHKGRRNEGGEFDHKGRHDGGVGVVRVVGGWGAGFDRFSDEAPESAVLELEGSLSVEDGSRSVMGGIARAGALALALALGWSGSAFGQSATPPAGLATSYSWCFGGTTYLWGWQSAAGLPNGGEYVLYSPPSVTGTLIPFGLPGHPTDPQVWSWTLSLGSYSGTCDYGVTDGAVIEDSTVWNAGASVGLPGGWTWTVGACSGSTGGTSDAADLEGAQDTVSSDPSAPPTTPGQILQQAGGDGTLASISGTEFANLYPGTPAPAGSGGFSYSVPLGVFHIGGITSPDFGSWTVSDGLDNASAFGDQQYAASAAFSAFQSAVRLCTMGIICWAFVIRTKAMIQDIL